MSPSLDDLSTFVTIARTGSVSRASQQLRVPKSSVSRALARLEEALGVELLHRTTRRSRLTTAGEALLARTEPLVAALTDAVSGAPERERTPAGLLRITATIDFSALVLAGKVARFTERWPAVTVEVHASNAVVDLVAGGFDLGIRFSPKGRLQDSSLVAKRLATLRTRLVASPDYIARRGTPHSPRDLAKHDWITYQGAESIVLETPGGTTEFAARGNVRGDDMFFTHAAALAGAGIARLPTFLAESDLASGRLVAVLPSWTMPSGTIWLVHPRSKHPPAKLVAFRDFMLEARDEFGL